MKKYDVALALASSRSIDKLALARMLIDMMELDELYEHLDYKGTFESLKELGLEYYVHILGIDLEERIQKIEDENEFEPKNYDVALTLSPVNIDMSRDVMELLNPKKPLDLSDFKTLDDIFCILDEMTDKMMSAKEMLERQNSRDKLAESLKRTLITENMVSTYRAKVENSK